VRAWHSVSFLPKLSSILSSNGTVSSTKATCLVESDHLTMSGLWLVTAISCGNLSWLFGSTPSFQSLSVPRISLARFAPLTSYPALTKEMSEGPWLTVFWTRLTWTTFCYGWQYLVVAPSVPAIWQDCPARTQHMLQVRWAATEFAVWTLG